MSDNPGNYIILLGKGFKYLLLAALNTTNIVNVRIAANLLKFRPTRGLLRTHYIQFVIIGNI